MSPAGPQWVAVNVKLQPRFDFGQEVTLPNGGLIDSVPFGVANERNYDFAPDGRRVALKPGETNPVAALNTRSIQVALNWFEELKQRVPAK